MYRQHGPGQAQALRCDRDQRNEASSVCRRLGVGGTLARCSASTAAAAVAEEAAEDTAERRVGLAKASGVVIGAADCARPRRPPSGSLGVASPAVLWEMGRCRRRGGRREHRRARHRGWKAGRVPLPEGDSSQIGVLLARFGNGVVGCRCRRRVSEVLSATRSCSP